MEGDIIKLYEGLELKVKQEPTAEDLQALADFGIDLLGGADYGLTLFQTFRDMKRMRILVGILFEGDIPKTIKKKIIGPAINEALVVFFAKYGLVLR